MSDQKQDSPELTETQQLIEKMKPVEELARLRRNISVYRLEQISADLQYKKLTNPQPNGDNQKPEQTKD